jgi:hypothetical protein
MEPQSPKTMNSNPPSREPESFMNLYPYIQKAGWGNDEFSKRIDSVFCNIGVSFYELSSHFEFLKESWTIFETLQQKVSKHEITPIPVELLLVRTFAAFLGASMMASGGLLTESMTLTRSMIENAVYANYIHKNPGMADVWINRTKDTSSIKRCKDCFAWGVVRNQISPVQLKNDIQVRYENCIEFGAHPNEKGSYINLTVTENQMYSCLQQGDPKLRKGVLCCVERSTVSVFEVFKTIFPHTFEKYIEIGLQNLHRLLDPIVRDAIVGHKDNP